VILLNKLEVKPYLILFLTRFDFRNGKRTFVSGTHERFRSIAGILNNLNTELKKKLWYS
jgi:hypothetical protein